MRWPAARSESARCCRCSTMGFRSALYHLRQNRLVAEMLRILVDSRSQIGSGLKAQLKGLAEQMGMDEGEE